MKHLLKILTILAVFIVPISIDAKGMDYISVKAERDISLSELLKSSRLDIADEMMVPFLKDFMSLNEDIKSLRIIPKGKIVKLPSRYFKVTAKVSKKKEKAKLAPAEEISKDITTITGNIKKLFDRLGETFSIRPGEIVVFPVSEKATLSVDTAYFPIIELPGKQLILIDPRGALPEEIRDVIEINWPEYSIISSRDTKIIINNILDAINYSCLDNGRVILGDDMQVEIKADCIIVKKDKDIMDYDITILSIIKENEFGFPERFLKWAIESGINIVDLFLKEPPVIHKEAKLLTLSKDKKKLVEDLITILGYETKRNVGLGLTDRRDYKLNIMADLVIRTEKRTKLIDMSGLPQPVINLLKRHGIDIMSIRKEDNSREIIKNLLHFLSLSYEDRPEIVSAMITPQRVKYRVRTNSLFVKSKNGPFLFSDYHNPELLLSLIDERISLIKYN